MAFCSSANADRNSGRSVEKSLPQSIYERLEMKFTGSLLLTTLFLVALTGYVTSLRAGGRNVLTRYVSYSVRQATSVRARTTNGQTCTRTCSWSCCYCRRCRTLYKTKFYTSYYYVRRYKAEYYCRPGWSPSGQECTIPICTGGCYNGGVCSNPETCTCSAGWHGSKCRTDINECVTNNAGCQHHCSNSQGSYSCSCNPGYNLVGKHLCQDINECLGINNCQQKCVNKPGSYSCACHTGYELNNDKTTCSDIDECIPRNNTPPACQYKCNNTAGSFFCSCPQGYLLTTNGRDCADHDECMTGSHTCQQRCVNHPGAYSCACEVGFSLNKDNQSCSDINECKAGTAGCAYQCNNTMGGFQCLCPSGYLLNSDNRTCSDHDECKSGHHGCSQICGNTPGSYYCTCKPGYYLASDFRTCKGYPCLSISTPTNGYMNCTGNTMDSVCQFSCQTGYEQVGSQLRTCLANGQWSGKRAFCKVKRCSKPSPPTNGYIQIPCSTVYKGKCSFACTSGFFLNGTQTVSCSADSKWRPSFGRCDVITVCNPNPCLRGGVCRSINSTAYRCNCTKTAYTGNKCHLGVFRTPKYPRLQVGFNLNITFTLSPPENDLVMTPSGPGVEFHPRSLLVSPAGLPKGTLYQAKMAITARLPGAHLIKYTLSGVDAKSYQTVLPDVVSVAENDTLCNDTASISFPSGCHKLRLFKCHNGDDFLNAMSTESWKRYKRQVSTEGFITILSSNLTLPLALRGSFDKMSLSSIQTDQKGECKAHTNMQCLPTETLASAFLKSLNASFPIWFRLVPSKTFSNFKANDMITYIWKGKQLKGVLQDMELSISEESYYSVLLYTNAITVKVGKSIVKLPNSVSVRVAGSVITHLQDRNEVFDDQRTTWRAGLKGNATINIILTLRKKEFPIEVFFDECTGFVQYLDTSKSYSCEIQDNYTLFLNGSVAKDPFTSNYLGSFIEGVKNKVNFFAYAHNARNASSRQSPGYAFHTGFYLEGTTKFGPLKFPSMSIKTEIFSQDFNRCSNHIIAPGLNISGTFQKHEVLGRFFNCSEGDSLQIFVPSDNENTTKGTLSTNVGLLGHSFQTRVRFANDSVSFQKELNLFHDFPISLNVTSKLQRWDMLLLKVHGRFKRSDPDGHNSLQDLVESMINDYVKIVAENTFHRLQFLQRTEEKVTSQIDTSDKRLYEAEKVLQKAVKQYLVALREEQANLMEVQRAEVAVSNGSSELTQIKSDLENLCSVAECPYVCASGTSCSTCYKDLITKEQGLCPGTCHNVEQRRVAPFEKTETCEKDKCESSERDLPDFSFANLKCEFNPENIVRKYAESLAVSALTGLVVTTNPWLAAAAYVGATVIVNEASSKIKSTKCGDSHEWNCEVIPYPCDVPSYNYVYIETPFSCQLACEINVIKETIASPCCSSVNCATRIVDMKCQEKNAFCRIVRNKALSKFDAAKRNLVKPFTDLQQAKKRHNIAKMNLVKRKLELEEATSNRDLLQRAHRAVLKAANISKMATKQNRALLADAEKLAQLWNGTNKTCPVKIKQISFDVTLSSPSESQIPVLFKIASTSKEKTIFPIVNFALLNESLRQTAKKIVKELFGNANIVLRSAHPLNQLASTQSKGRKKRSVDEGSSDVTTLMEFKKKCALVTNYQRALSNIIGSLYNISTESSLLLNNATNDTLKVKHAEAHDFAVNVTQASKLGLSEKDVDDSVIAVPADEEVVNASSLVELRNVTNRNKVQTAIDMVFRDWEASMETVFNFTSLECNGFVDCMEDFVDNLLYLYQGIDLPGVARLQRQIAILSTEVKSLLSHEDLSVAEAAEKSSRILQMLRDIKDKNVFCAVAPNITHNPVAKKDLKIGQTLELSCKATADLVPSYRWRKNGVLIPGSNTEILRIGKVTENDSGNYTCEAYNHVKVQMSTPSHIFVHAPPNLVHQPPSNMNIPVNTGFHIRCNATSNTKPLRYQWLFMPIYGDSYSLVPNGNFSVLSFNSVKRQEEGFYKCNVSSPFDYTLSRSVRLRVLGFSLVVPSLGLSFEIVGDNKSLHDAYEEFNKVQNGENPLHVNKNFQQEVELAFIRIVYNLVDLPSNAVQDLTIEDCEIIDEDNNVSCNVSFRLRSFNMTGPESVNRTEEENAVSVMDSVKQLQSAAARLVNESNARGINLNVRGVGLKIDATSWNVGEYISLCPIGKVLYENNFVCVNCPPGTRGAINGTSPACFPCPEGTYQPEQGQTSCVPCPVGSNSRRTGLEYLSSCKDLSPETTTSQTSQPPDVSTNPSVPSTFSVSTSKEPGNDEDTTKETKEPKAMDLQSHNDVASKWKVAFGVCMAIIIILLAGVVFYAINYRVKKIGWFQATPGNSNKKEENPRIQNFQNPIYDVNEADQQEPVNSHENPAYQMTDDPNREEKMTQSNVYQTITIPVGDANIVDKQAPGYSHENPAYQMTDDPDGEKKMAQPDVYHTIENPVCDVNGVAKQEPGYSHENPAYQMTDNPDKEI
ncbi:hypothetical protein ACROYT_G043090 [Oculina patagonica]